MRVPSSTCTLEYVFETAREEARQIHPGHDDGFITQVCSRINSLFQGQVLDYQPIDLRYHDFGHTLQATLCYIRLARGRRLNQASPRLDYRAFELGFAATMFHDCGYLRVRSDTEGTGAKYTHCHVVRSCALAASTLPLLSCTLGEIDGIINAIRCTGPYSQISEIIFHSEEQRINGQLLATADYLAQMAADDYLEKLPFLFSEFQESDEYHNVPVTQRAFKSVDELLKKTPVFWTHFVLPKLDSDFGRQYSHLSAETTDGTNPYLLAIEENLQLIQKH